MKFVSRNYPTGRPASRVMRSRRALRSRAMTGKCLFVVRRLLNLRIAKADPVVAGITASRDCEVRFEQLSAQCALFRHEARLLRFVLLANLAITTVKAYCEGISSLLRENRGSLAKLKQTPLG